MYFIFFSRWQKTYSMETGCGAMFAKLEDGRIVEYTEMCSKERPSGDINDYVFLGKGDFSHIVEASKDTEETMGTISRRKFDPLLKRPSPRENLS